jgi:glycosyltransferase involved in cell wall biosynthesis
LSAPPVAFVVQRYGTEVIGGSESLARVVAERLAHKYQITVLTTCARDYVTWRNELPEGESALNGVRVRRFKVAEERDLAAFNRYAEPLYERAASAAEESEWLRRQGPYVPELVRHLQEAEQAGRYHAVVFFTYLYYPTVAGLKVAARNSVLVPTAHDEPALRLRLFAEVFAAPRALAFCSRPEAALVSERFGLAGRPHAVTGVGVEVSERPAVEAFKIRHDLTGPYVVYAGRIDAGKGCDEMLAWYARYRQDCRGAAELLLLGTLAMPEPHIPGVRFLGFLSEEEKHAAFAGAAAVLCPSPYESLSIVLLEAFAHGTPGLVTSRSAVLLDHCRRANAGLWYASAAEFAEALELLVATPSLRAALGANGRAYVRANYRWQTVIERYASLIEAAASAGQ